MRKRHLTGAATAAVAPAASAVLALPRTAGAADTAPVGFGAGTTGGGTATAVTVSTPDAFKAAVTGGSAKVVKVNGLISLSGQIDIGSNTTVLGIGSSSGFTGGGLRLKKVTNVVVRNLDLSRAVKVGAETAVHSRMGAQMLVGNNVFRGTAVAVTTSRDSDADGYANLRGNDLGGAATEISRTGTFTSPPYGYTAEPASGVVTSMTAGAGAGKI
ncbi:hypothetical protein [Streptomyces sp. NPDC015414]|uniref:hypothetical protein n=1 Tax=Streptomyces sp. NPDC015414 TaxID=3364957 RepID=UPI0036FCE362